MGAKIYVVKLTQIIRAAVSLIIVIGVILGIAGIIKRSSRPTYNPGVYTSRIILHNSPVNVEVEVSAHTIESVRILELSETQQVFYPLFASSADEIAQKIVAEQSCDIALDSDYEVTGGIILDAVRQALDQAKKD